MPAPSKRSLTDLWHTARAMRRHVPAFIWLACLASPGWAEQYEFDKVHTQILFFVDHLGYSKSQGEFLEFDGRFSFDKSNFESTQVELTILTDSIDMDDEEWNREMKGKRYLNTGEHPTIRFASTSVEPLDNKSAIVHGQLTILGRTQPIALQMTFNKIGISLTSGKQVVGFSGRTTLNRSDFGMKSFLRFIGNEVEIRLEVEGFAEPRRKHDR